AQTMDLSRFLMSVCRARDGRYILEGREVLCMQLKGNIRGYLQRQKEMCGNVILVFAINPGITIRETGGLGQMKRLLGGLGGVTVVGLRGVGIQGVEMIGCLVHMLDCIIMSRGSCIGRMEAM